MTAHCPAPPPNGYAPLPCHSVQPAPSETAFTGTQLAGPSIALALALMFAALAFGLRRLVRSV